MKLRLIKCRLNPDAVYAFADDTDDADFLRARFCAHMNFYTGTPTLASVNHLCASSEELEVELEAEDEGDWGSLRAGDVLSLRSNDVGIPYRLLEQLADAMNSAMENAIEDLNDSKEA